MLFLLYIFVGRNSILFCFFGLKFCWVKQYSHSFFWSIFLLTKLYFVSFFGVYLCGTEQLFSHNFAKINKFIWWTKQLFVFKKTSLFIFRNSFFKKKTNQACDETGFFDRIENLNFQKFEEKSCFSLLTISKILPDEVFRPY